MITLIAARSFRSGVTLDLNYTESYAFPYFLEVTPKFCLQCIS